MIVIEDFIREDGLVLKRVFSDKGFYIRKISTGEEYVSAVNLNLSVDMFVETEHLIEEVAVDSIEE